MDFELVFKKILAEFERENIHYGLIGGFALGAMGILRATMDIDLLVLIDDMDKVGNILTTSMYRCDYKTEYISQYSSELRPLGNIDIIHASKSISREMLSRTKMYTVFEKYMVPVLLPEDIIGLKLQAISNDPSREAIDLNDIRLILTHQREYDREIDWELLKDYFELFKKDELFLKLTKEFGP